MPPFDMPVEPKVAEIPEEPDVNILYFNWNLDIVFD